MNLRDTAKPLALNFDAKSKAEAINYQTKHIVLWYWFPRKMFQFVSSWSCAEYTEHGPTMGKRTWA